jgi:2-polyprenyl-3-methyl-5-hydroxy-6-metoxy-1,4-benzoquinol methylase
MLRYIKRAAATIIDKVADRVAQRMNDGRFSDDIACRILAETSFGGAIPRKDPDFRQPNELFAGISDGFWFWLCTEGCRTIPSLKTLLPGMPPDDVQLLFSGDKGVPVLREGFSAYALFRDLYESHVGPIADCAGVMDFGCGWGRIIRFFLKDVDPSRLFGVDPAEEVINLCRSSNRWCAFDQIQTKPPTRFQDSTFDLIYSFSVFSHLSEEMQQMWLLELRRVLKAGGLMIATTRSREFIEHCGKIRQLKDLALMHRGPRSSASAFLNTEKHLSEFDKGTYCFSQLVHEGEWSYWGEAAIPKGYVENNWSRLFSVLDYIDDRNRCAQNVIVVRKT